MLGLLLLPLYVTVDTSRALASYGFLNSGVALSPALLTFASESTKLAVAAGAVLYLGKDFRLPPSPNSSSSFTAASVTPYLKFAVPAALYAINNLLFFEGLRITSPALLQIAVLSKLPLTALLHHLVVRRRPLLTHSSMWLSLSVLSFGLILAGAPEALYDALWEPNLRKTIQVKDLAVGPAIGGVIGVVSACASVWTEVVLATEVPFYTAQVHLYSWGALFTGVFALVRGIPAVSGSAFLAYLILVPVTAFSGLLVASILRQRDNLVKLVGASLCITTVYLSQHLFFPRIGTIEPRSVFGIGVLTIATWCFNYYKDADKPVSSGPIYLELSTNEDGEFRFSEEQHQHQHKIPMEGPDTPSLSVPNTPSISTSPSAPAPSPKDPYRPTPLRLTLSTILLLFLTTLSSFAPRSPHSLKRDLASYFAPHGLTPSVWDANIPVTRPYCLFEGIRSLLPDEQSDFIADIEDRWPELGCPTYPIPDEGYIFHAFWSGPWRNPSHYFTTDAFLATQRLHEGMRLIWWYEGEGPTDDFLQRYTSPSSPYSPYVSVKRFDEAREAKGSCLESMREWTDPEYAKEVGVPITTKSDLVRLLLLKKYGGVWLDADTVPLRDLAPLARIGPTVPYAPHDTAINNHLLIYGPSWGGYAARMLEMACSMPYEPSLLAAKYPNFKEKAAHYWLYNDGVHRLCEQEGCGIYGSPLEWLDLQSDGWTHDYLFSCNVNATTGVGPYLPKNPLPAQLHGPFAYHARMAKHADNDRCWDDDSGTAVSAVYRRIKAVLKRSDWEKGHDLFPGPGYVSLPNMTVPGPDLRPNGAWYPYRD